MEVEILDRALQRLRDQTGLVAESVVPTPALARPGDATVVFCQGDRELAYLVACRAKVDRVAMLDHVLAIFDDMRQPGLLVTDYLSPTLAQHCRQIGLSFLDAAGNAYLHDHGLFVWLAGQKPDKGRDRRERTSGAFHGRGLRVVFALLAHPPLLQAPYREIAEAARASLGTTSQSLGDLVQRGFLVVAGDGTRRWVDRPRVLQTWATTFPLSLRGRLAPRRYQARADDWWKDARPEAFGGAWSGEVAAARMLDDLAPRTATVYLPEDRSPFLAAHRLKADPQGAIEVLDMFWSFRGAAPDPDGVAPALLVYADLVSLGDPRTAEQAERIRGRYLA
jgi:hypothetical protein